MQIAVDARFLQHEETRFGDFTTEVFSRLATCYPQHQFIFFTDQKNGLLQKMPQNVSYLRLTPQPSHALLYKWWFDVKVPLALKKCGADVFVCPNGWCSLTTSVPQVFILQNFSLEKSPGLDSTFNVFFFKNAIASFLKKSKMIGVSSHYIKKEITGLYTILPEKIIVIGSGASQSYTAVSWQEKEEIKEKYSQGCEYFIFNTISGSPKNLIKTLKAFSIFKKWQKTNMKLILAGAAESTYKNEREKLITYKYKNDVIVTHHLPKQEMAKVVAGAYAAIFFESNFVTIVIETMQCEVPLIIAGNEALAEMEGEAALLAQAAEPEQIAAQLKLIFKDEQLRSQLIEKGKTRAKEFSWDKTAALTWQLIEKAVSR